MTPDPLAPLRGKTWTVDGEVMGFETVESTYRHVSTGSLDFYRVRWSHRNRRRSDRALQILRRTGLVEYRNSAWRLTRTPKETS